MLEENLFYSLQHGCETDECKKQLRVAKIILIIFLGFVTYLASLAPWIMRKCFKRRALDLINVCSSLAAGIVFGAFLAHMIPEASEAFHDYFHPHHHHDDDDHDHLINSGLGHGGHGGDKVAHFPWAPMIVGLTTIFLISIDKIIVAKGIDGTESHHGHSHDHISGAFLAMQGHEERQIRDGTIYENPEPPKAGLVVTFDSTNDNSLQSSLLEAEEPLLDSRPSAPTATGATLIRVYVFFFALSLHSLMDGLSIGSEESMEGFYAIMAAVVSHKIFDGLAIGVPLFFANLARLRTTVLLVFCALMTPLGIIIGLITTSTVSNERTKALAQGIILSISAGSFLFISMFELFPASIADGRFVKSKLAMFTVGWAVMNVMALVI